MRCGFWSRRRWLWCLGLPFGDCGEGYLRISYAYSLQDLKRALERMGRFVASLEEM